MLTGNPTKPAVKRKPETLLSEFGKSKPTIIPNMNRWAWWNLFSPHSHSKIEKLRTDHWTNRKTEIYTLYMYQMGTGHRKPDLVTRVPVIQHPTKYNCCIWIAHFKNEQNIDCAQDAVWSRLQVVQIVHREVGVLSRPIVPVFLTTRPSKPGTGID